MASSTASAGTPTSSSLPSGPTGRACPPSVPPTCSASLSGFRANNDFFLDELAGAASRPFGESPSAGPPAAVAAFACSRFHRSSLTPPRPSGGASAGGSGPGSSSGAFPAFCCSSGELLVDDTPAAFAAFLAATRSLGERLAIAELASVFFPWPFFHRSSFMPLKPSGGSSAGCGSAADPSGSSDPPGSGSGCADGVPDILAAVRAASRSFGESPPVAAFPVFAAFGGFCCSCFQRNSSIPDKPSGGASTGAPELFFACSRVHRSICIFVKPGGGSSGISGLVRIALRLYNIRDGRAVTHVRYSK
jgi:hypothetical protein